MVSWLSSAMFSVLIYLEDRWKVDSKETGFSILFTLLRAWHNLTAVLGMSTLVPLINYVISIKDNYVSYTFSFLWIEVLVCILQLLWHTFSKT